MEDWMECKYTDIAEIVGGGTPKTTESLYWNGHIPWLSVKDFANCSKYVYNTEKTITQLGLENSSTKLLTKDNIIISARGTVGELAMIPFKMAFNQSCFGIKAKEGIDAEFLFYYTKTIIRKLKAQAQGSIFDTITIKTFENTNCNIPSLNIQKRIVSILSSLDDKIEVNRKINENLEQQAQALFKSWFVDFEPFKDGKFVDSELGMIPEGWEVKELQSLVTIKRGGSPRPIQNYLTDNGLRWLKISDATSETSPFISNIKEHIKEEGLHKTVFLKEGNLVLSNSATPGIPKFLGVDTCIHDGWLYFPKSELSNEYLYLLFKLNRKKLLIQGNGSVFLNLKTDILKSLKIIVPSNLIILNKYDMVLHSIFKEIKHFRQEIENLTNLRDTLLPKLMSGEIEI